MTSPATVGVDADSDVTGCSVASDSVASDSVAGGWLVLRLTGSLTWLFVCLTLALVIYGTIIAAAVASGTWFTPAARRSN